MQHDFILLDRSGSMGSIWAEAIGSVNSYVKGLAEKKVDTGVTLAAFDADSGTLDFHIVRDRIIPVTWRDVTVSEVKPRGMTPLNDATARLVSMANNLNAEKTAIIIMTDGAENASHEFSVQQIRTMLDGLRAAPKFWQVIFLGANFDNQAQAASYGAVRGMTVNDIQPQNMAATMSFMSAKRGEYGSASVGPAGVSATMDFTELEKATLQQGQTPPTAAKKKGKYGSLAEGVTGPTGKNE